MSLPGLDAQPFRPFTLNFPSDELIRLSMTCSILHMRPWRYTTAHFILHADGACAMLWKLLVRCVHVYDGNTHVNHIHTYR
jgi:hypothetical protein